MSVIQALSNHYQRLFDDPETPMPDYGFGFQKIHFALELNLRGELIQIRDLRLSDKKKPRPCIKIVPGPAVRSVNISANFLWDNTKYVLGVGLKKDTSTPEVAFFEPHFQDFRVLLERVTQDLELPELEAVRRFLDDWQPARFTDREDWQEVLGQNLVFRLAGSDLLLHDHETLRRAWSEHLQAEPAAAKRGFCLVTGEETDLARLHPAIKGVKGAQTSGAPLVSFNEHAFNSYGKEQSYNAPMGVRTAFAYTTALNYLLAEDRHRIVLGDTSFVFWSEAAGAAENFFSALFRTAVAKAGEDMEQTQNIGHFLKQFGRRSADPAAVDPDLNPETGFYILGLSPNAARLSVRFWLAGTLGGLAEKLRSHFDDLAMIRSFDHDPAYPGLDRLVRQAGFQGRADGVPARFAGDLARAVFSGGPYPRAFIQAVINRIRLDRETRKPFHQKINFERAALLKAFLLRQARFYQKPWEVSMALDEQHPHPAYRIGRLFAVLEKAQEAAGTGLNSTIKDRFFGSAMTTPAAVFPQLLRLANHHMTKAKARAAEKGHGAFNYERRLGEILEGITQFPKVLTLEEQGLFVVGYYHQRQHFFKKTTKEQTS